MAGRNAKDPAYGQDEPPSEQECVAIVRSMEGGLQTAATLTDKTLQAMLLLQRSSCYARLSDHDSVVSDLKRVLKLIGEMRDVQTTVGYVRRCLILAQYKKQKLSQAEDIVREWLNQLYAMSEERKQPIAILERYLVIFQLSNCNGGGGKRPQQTILDTEMQQLDEKLNNWIRDSMPGDQLTEHELHPFRVSLASGCAKTKQLLDDTLAKAVETGGSGKTNASKSAEQDKKQQQQQDEGGKGKKRSPKNKDLETFKCTYCAITFENRGELTVHCQSESHQIVIMSDEGIEYFH